MEKLMLDSDIIDVEMQNAFQRSQGLTMLDFRTGSGKSFDLEKNIARCIHNWRTSWKLIDGKMVEENIYPFEQIIVLIPNKNNFLNSDSLAERLMEIAPGTYTLAEAKKVISESVYTMPDNLDCIIAGLSNENGIDEVKVKEICDTIDFLWKQKSVQNELKQNFYSIQDYAICKNDSKFKIYVNSMKQVAEAAENNIRNRMRKFISDRNKIIKNKNMSEKEKDKAKEEGQKCIDLVSSFYETARYNKYRVIVTSVDKFMYSVDPVVSNRFCFYDKNFVKNRLIIFDESDSAYVRMRDVIIKKVNNSTFEFKEYLKTIICNYLETQPTQAVENAEKMAFKKKNNKCSWENLKKQGKEILEKYYLRYPYKTDEESEKNGKMPALLNDGILYSLSEKQGYIHALKSQGKKQVLLSVGNSSDDILPMSKGDEIVNIADLFYEGNAFIFRFCCFLNALAFNYPKIMKKEKNDRIGEGDDEEITFLNSLTTILNMFGIIGKEQEFYKEFCLNLNSRPKRLDLFDVDDSFYIRGYDLKIISDNAMEHAENSFIYSHIVNITPESILLTMAQNTHVICLSATALNRSVNENFDIFYLQAKLGKSFYTVSGEAQKKLREFYAYKEKPYFDGKAVIDVVALPENTATISGDGRDNRLLAKEEIPAFRNPKILKNILDEITCKIPEKLDDNKYNYYFGRYLNLVHALYEFIKTPSLKSMVILEKALVKENNDEFDFELLNKIKDNICQDLDIPESGKNIPLVIAKAEDFFAKKEEVNSYWEKGEKAIFFTTYQTTGRGSNLQYRIPNNEKIRNNLVTLLPEFQEDERFYNKYNFKDVDCLYLGNYTYLLAKIEGDNTRARTECFHRVLFELQKLAYNGQISFWEKNTMVRNRYRMVIGKEKEKIQNWNQLIQTEGISNTVNKIIKQSVGRLDRVNQKNSITKIFIASENLKHIDLNELADTEYDLTPAMKKIFEAAQLVQGESRQWFGKCKEECVVLNKGSKQHNVAVEYIKRILLGINQAGNMEKRNFAIKEYELVRDFVLRYPVVSQKTFDSLSSEFRRVVGKLYIDSCRNDVFSYVYTINPKEEGYDLDRCHVQIEGFNSSMKGRWVAEENTILNVGLKVPGVWDKFQQKGYCTTWERGRYILTPKGMQIYNGILGEEIEKIILQEIIRAVKRFDGKLYLPAIEELDPDVFEKFDFRYGNVYIDAKNWRGEIDRLDANEFRQKALNKKIECDEFYHQKGTVVILNLLPKDEENYLPYDEAGYHVTPALINTNGQINQTACNKLLNLFRKANEYAGKNK